MRIKLLSLEDGITACGFRKFAAHVARLNADTESWYVSTTPQYLSIRNAIRGTFGVKADLGEEDVEAIATSLVGNDLVGFSSMTAYADLTRKIIRRVRELDPSVMLVWGGIHPIIHPEDAIEADVDAICIGEGELAFEELFGHLRAGTDFREVKNFWFKRDGAVVRNGFLPLMSSEDMETLAFSQYFEDGERIYRSGRGFVPMALDDYLVNSGLAFRTVWSIGCPFHCTFCGNTKFIANDSKYKKIRHPSARYAVEEVKRVRRRLPHVSQVTFFDDSFMAIPFREIEKFAVHWKEELGIPFAVYGVIPNYVARDKFEVLTWAGMNRIRMGIQSGSHEILDFYKRPTPIEKIDAATEVCGSFAPKFHIAPAYDIIVDNPIETRQDVVDTLELLYRTRRPWTPLVYSLKVIPNTELERSMRERGVDIEEISASYSLIPPRLANLLVYLLAVWRPPRWLFERLLRGVEASATPQRLYPKLGLVLRTLYLVKRALGDLRFMDFSIIPGRTGYVFWKLGIVGFWQRRFTKRHARPVREDPRPLAPPAAATVDLSPEAAA